jgi:solute carrier family 35 protein E1
VWILSDIETLIGNALRFKRSYLSTIERRPSPLPLAPTSKEERANRNMALYRKLIEYLNRNYPGSPRKLNSIMRQCRVPLYFALWYLLNILYNITNKWALEGVRGLVDTAILNGRIHNKAGVSSSLPLTMGCLQFAVGSIYACVLWLCGWRPLPHAGELRGAIDQMRRCKWRAVDGHSYSSVLNINTEDSAVSNPKLSDTSHIAIYHTLGQLCTVLSLSLNSIGFAHVIKAMEPFFSAIASRVYFGKRMDIRVYLALIPVVGGVILAVAGSDEFSWLAFWFGMGSNVFFAIRAVVSKIAMSSSSSECSHFTNDTHMTTQSATQISPCNLFAAVTCISFAFSIPLAVIFEGRILMDTIKYVAAAEADIGNGQDKMTILWYISCSGLFHYLNNEVMYQVLDKVHPITLAVGNTLKRVFIIVAGVVVFSTPVSWQTAIGSTIGITGVLVYSLMKQWYDSDQRERKDHLNSDGDNDEILVTELVESGSYDAASDQHLISRKYIITDQSS